MNDPFISKDLLADFSPSTSEVSMEKNFANLKKLAEKNAAEIENFKLNLSLPEDLVVYNKIDNDVLSGTVEKLEEERHWSDSEVYGPQLICFLKIKRINLDKYYTNFVYICKDYDKDPLDYYTDKQVVKKLKKIIKHIEKQNGRDSK